MRENMGLYRGKREDNGEWVEGFYVRLHDSKGHESHRIYSGYAETDCGDYYPDWHEVIPETVGECPGLPDKNGVLIFEGDILRYFDDEIQVVEWNDEAHQIMLHTYAEYERKAGRKAVKEKCEGWHYLNDYPLNEMSIIGNIHDNPELLGVSGDE